MHHVEWILAGVLAAAALTESCPPPDEDGDGDGFTVAQGDCDDGDPAVFPGAEEVCNGKDDDCDGAVDAADPDLDGGDVYFADRDGDGYGDPTEATVGCTEPAGFVENGQDCDDGDAGVNPGRPGSCTGTGVIVLSPDGGDGEGYGYEGIQGALDGVREGDTIYLEPGTYRVNVRFPRKSVALVGTVAGRVVLDGSGCVAGEDTCSVVRFTWARDGGPLGPASPGARLQDLVLTGGHGTVGGGEFDGAPTYAHGGGLLVADADPTIQGLEVRDNAAIRGGGVYVLHEAPTIVGSTFAGNTADTGGGAYVSYSNAAFLSCRFEGNRAQSGGGLAADNGDPYLRDIVVTGNVGEYGAGLNLTLSSPRMENFVVVDNIGLYLGGGFYIYDSRATLVSGEVSGNTAKSGAGLNLLYANLVIQDVTVADNEAEEYGGGLYLYESNPVLDRMVVSGNRSEHGGGFNLSYANIRVTNSIVQFNVCNALGGGFYVSSSRPQLTNVVIQGNEAGARGGGFYESYSNAELVNVTLAGNRAGTDGGGFFAHFNSVPVITNTIFAFNSAQEAGDNIYIHEASSVDLSYNLYFTEAGGAAGLEGTTAAVTDIVADPLFVDDPTDGDVADDDYHLQAGSPAIDAGQPGPTYNDPDGSRNDIGAYGGPGAERW